MADKLLSDTHVNPEHKTIHYSAYTKYLHITTLKTSDLQLLKPEFT